MDRIQTRWRGLATDFDGTIATDGVLDEPTREALLRMRERNLHVFLVTGRELRDFQSLNLSLRMFDMVVAENGGVLYNPRTNEAKPLAPRPPDRFVEELARRHVTPISAGMTIVATLEPHEITAIEVIKEFGLELQVIFNKGSVMILPTGVNKASGLVAALKEFNISPEEIAGVGDAENDHAFLELCGLPVAVANALPALKEKAAWVTQHNAGSGVVELIEAMLRGDLERIEKPEIPVT